MTTYAAPPTHNQFNQHADSWENRMVDLRTGGPGQSLKTRTRTLPSFFPAAARVVYYQVSR
jgi:hypothetical protein